VAFRLAHLKRQHQLQALGGDKPLGGANTVIPTAASTMDHIGEALEKLFFAASNDTTVLQQLTAANLALTASVPCSQPPTRCLRMRWRKTKAAGHWWRHRHWLQGRVTCQTSLSRVAIAGSMAIRSIRTTRVQPADTRLRDTRTMQQAPT
jgi:hypothetical protein